MIASRSSATFLLHSYQIPRSAFPMTLDATNERLYDLNVRTTNPSHRPPRSSGAGLEGRQFSELREAAGNDFKKRTFGAHHGIIRVGRTESFFQ